MKSDRMDLNYLLHRQQVERIRAEAATSEAARRVHQELARRYETEIERLAAKGFKIRTPDRLKK